MADAHAAPVAQSLVAKIVSSYVRKNQIAPADVSALIDTVHRSLLELMKPVEPEPERTPAVPIRRSVTPEYVVCLECGHRGKTLRSHLQAKHSLTPNEYRVRWGLPSAHPLTAPAYSERRSAVAKQIGLGQKHLGRRRRQAPQEPA
jgi:predicted transcriptional regulator